MGTVESHSWVKWAKRANWWTVVILMMIVASTNGQSFHSSTTFYNQHGLRIGLAVDGGYAEIYCSAAEKCTTMQLIDQSGEEVATANCAFNAATFRLDLNENTKFGQYQCQADKDENGREDALNYQYRMCNNAQTAKCDPGKFCFFNRSNSESKCDSKIDVDLCDEQHKPVKTLGLCKGEVKGSESSLCHGIAKGMAKDIVALEATKDACIKNSPLMSYQNVTAEFGGTIWVTESDPNITVIIPEGSKAVNANVTCDLMCNGNRVPWGSEDVVDSSGSKVFSANPSLFNRTKKCELGCKVEKKQTKYNASLWTKVYTIANPKITHEIIEFDLMVRVERNEGWPDGLEIKNCTLKSPSGKQTNGLWALSREGGEWEARCIMWFPPDRTRRDTRKVFRRDTQGNTGDVNDSKTEENRRQDSGNGADTGEKIKKENHIDPEKEPPSNSDDQNRRSRPEEDDEDGKVTDEDDDTNSTSGNIIDDTGSNTNSRPDTADQNRSNAENKDRSEPDNVSKKEPHGGPEKKSPSNHQEEDDEDGIVTDEDDDTNSTSGNFIIDDGDHDTVSKTNNRPDTADQNRSNAENKDGSEPDSASKKEPHGDPEKKSPRNSEDQNPRSDQEDDDEDGIVTDEDDETSSTSGNIIDDTGSNTKNRPGTVDQNHSNAENKDGSEPESASKKEPHGGPEKKSPIHSEDQNPRSDQEDDDEDGKVEDDDDYGNDHGTSSSTGDEGEGDTDNNGDSGHENPNDEGNDENNRQRRDSSSGGGSKFGSAHGRGGTPLEYACDVKKDLPPPPKCYTYITGACLTEYQFWLCVKLTILAAVLYTLGFTLLALGCWYKRRLDNLWAHDDPDGPGKELAAIEAKCAKEKKRLEDVFDGIRKRRAEEGVTAQRAAEERAAEEGEARMRGYNKPHGYDRRGKPSGGHKVHQSPSSSYGGSTPRYRTPSRSPSPHHRHQSPSREHRKPSQERDKPSRERSPSHGRRSHGKPKWDDRR